MKYLFINSVAGVGSTGRIAADQCRKLQEQGHQCVLAYGRAKANCEDVQTIRIGTQWDCRWHGVLTRVFDKHGFGSKRATYKFLKWVEEYNPDVIWLHNLHGYYINIELLFAWIKKHPRVEVKWTLHDCWPFTGHCSHFDYIGCNRWQKGCFDCPQKCEYPKSNVLDNSKQNFERKKEAFLGVHNLSLIVPSQWLKELVEKSFLKIYPIRVVYNTIDTTVFKATPSNFREEYELQDKKIILGVANIWGEKKGLNDFLKLADMLDDQYVIVLVGLNCKQMKLCKKNMIGLERTNSAVELAQIYTAADIFVNFSVEETFGLTTIEALSCGTPVIVYEGTACEEVVLKTSGYVVERNVEQVYKVIKRIN